MAGAIAILGKGPVLVAMWGPKPNGAGLLCPRHIKGGMNDATAGQPTTAEHWLTYADAAERLRLTLEAVRALARRQHWQRRSPNAVGGQTWILYRRTD